MPASTSTSASYTCTCHVHVHVHETPSDVADGAAMPVAGSLRLDRSHALVYEHVHVSRARLTPTTGGAR